MKIKALSIAAMLFCIIGNAFAAEADESKVLPCPANWTVENNPSVENSLSYLHDNKDLAINVTYIANRVGDKVSADTYARVASQKLACTLPVKSNLIKDAWFFYCEDNNVEAVVYGPEGNLVLLTIAGRTDKNEEELRKFVNFLNYQANIK